MTSIVAQPYGKCFVLALLLVSALAVYFWTQSRYPSLDEKAMMSGAIQLEDTISFEALYPILPEYPVWKKIALSTVNWMKTNKQGMTFAIFFAAAFLTLLGYMQQRSFRNGFANSFMGLFIGAPLGVCVNCAALGGGIVDFAHRAKIRSEAQSAADSAAIAAARIIQLGQLNRSDDMDAVKAQARAAATNIVDAALAKYGGGTGAGLDIQIDGDTIQVSANVDMDTAFLGVIGINNLQATAMSEVNLPDPVLVEIAMVLDYSGSMNDDDKYVRMTAAARDFIAKVKDDRGQTSKIGIVPFSEYVFMPISTSYLRDTGSGFHDHGDDGGGWGGGSTGTVTTCLLNRDYPYSATDQAPSSSLPESQWVEGDDTK